MFVNISGQNWNGIGQLDTDCSLHQLYLFSSPCQRQCELLPMPSIGIERREIPIHYHSDRINTSKQISSLPDILIKLKTEINAVLETPLAVE
jgi:hypothetical protein